MTQVPKHVTELTGSVETGERISRGDDCRRSY